MLHLLLCNFGILDLYRRSTSCSFLEHRHVHCVDVAQNSDRSLGLKQDRTLRHE